MENTNIFISDLPADLDESTLNTIFGAYGTVTWSKLMPSKGKPTQAAIVEFGDVAEAKWVVENINGNIAQGLSEPITITFKQNRQSKGDGKGKDGGKFGKAGGKEWSPPSKGEWSPAGKGEWSPGSEKGKGKGETSYGAAMGKGADSWGAGKSGGFKGVSQGPYEAAKGGGKWGGAGDWGGKGGGKWDDGKGKSKGFRVVSQNADSTVWLGGIPEGVTHEEIKTNFAAAGTVKRVQVLGKGGTGFAWFETPEEAAMAITMFNGMEMNGSTLQVDVWTRKEKGEGK